MTSQMLSEHVALVTGASRGIGAAMAIELARAGAHVILAARTVKGLEQTDDAIRAIGGTATIMPLDLTKLDELNNVGQIIFERFKRLDIFVGNAGILGTLGPVHHTDPKEWDKVMNINVNANFRLIRSLDPLLRAAPHGRAVFLTTSDDVTHGRAYWGAYGASKAALNSMVCSYAAETQKTNMRVNLIDPGRTRTDLRAIAKPGEDPLTLKTPQDLAPKLMEFVLPNCTRHGEMMRF